MTGTPAATWADHLAIVMQRFDSALTACGHDAVVIDAGVANTYFLDDIHVPFRANPWLRQWLPVWPCEGFLLGYRPGYRPVVMYLQPDDYWHMPPRDPAGEWASHMEVRPVTTRAAAEHALGEAGFTLDTRTAWLGPAAADVPAQVALNPAPLLAWLDWDRAAKTPWEVACLRRASAAAARGHLAARAAFDAGASERAIHLAYLEASGHLDDELPYHSIVAIDRHAAVLHYQHKDAQPPGDARTLLIDAGAADHGYAADVTRTWTRPGTPAPFVALVDRMDALQRELIDEIRPGLDYVALHERLHARLAHLLVDAGIVRGGSVEAVVQSGISRRFCPHGLGHQLGLMTHDAGGRLAARDGTERQPPPSDPALRNTRVIEVDQCFTIEPGLYFIDALLADLPRAPGGSPWLDEALLATLHPCGGIRVEDNVVVHDAGVTNLTRAAFAALA